MTEEFHGYREPQETWLQENVSAEDYKAALQLLTRFTECDVQALASLEQLAVMTEGVGPALRAIAVSRGHFTPGEIRWENFGAGAPIKVIHNPQYELKGQRGDDLIFLKARKQSYQVFLPAEASLHEYEQELVEVRVRPPFGHYTSNQETIKALFYSGYGVALFADRPLRVSEYPPINLDVEADETPAGADRQVRYQPLLHPENAQVQQAYARVLQTCVKDVLSLNPPSPTEVPAAFYQ